MASTGDSLFSRYRRGETPLAEPNLAWNTYGKGIEGIGRDGCPEATDVPAPAADQMLVRIDAVGLCFSDVKLIRLGGDHPKLYGRDLAVDPIRLGHEAAVTIIDVGEDLESTYHPGDRLAIQPDIYVDGRATSYGYTIPGGLIQHHLIGPEVLDADHGAYVIGVDDGVGYAAAALSEPWACVEAAYTQRRRLWPLEGGKVWILGHRADERDYDFGDVLRNAALAVTTDLSRSIQATVQSACGPGTVVEEADGVTPSGYGPLSEQYTRGQGFDDIIILDPHSAAQLSAAAPQIAFRGTLNLVGERPLDGLAEIDFGRIHYDYTAYVGTRGPDVGAAYGESRNRCELRPEVLLFLLVRAGPWDRCTYSVQSRRLMARQQSSASTPIVAVLMPLKPRSVRLPKRRTESSC